jgi:predicted chitinase
VGFRTAAWFWTSRKLNALADAGDFKEITHRINDAAATMVSSSGRSTTLARCASCRPEAGHIGRIC